MKALRFRLETLALAIALVCARLIPRRVFRWIGTAFGTLWWLLDARHRRVALDNLRHAYGDSLSTADARRLVHSCWRHYGRTIFDTLAFHRFSADSVGSLFQCEGLDHLRAAYARGKGVLVFSAHYGHWELGGLVQGYLGMPLTVIARPLDNPALERRLAQLRGRSGNAILHRQNAAREMLQTLRRGGGIAILIDQDAHQGGVFVPFFGRLASTTPALGLLALRTGAAVLPCFVVPEKDGRYRITYGPEIVVPIDGDRDTNVERITAECTAIVERWVRKHPELWLWMHRRWKTRPPGRPEAG